MSRRTGTCMNCQEEERELVKGLCFKCYRRKERDEDSDKPNRVAARADKKQIKAVTGILKIVKDSLDVFSEEEVNGFYRILHPHLEAIANSALPVNSEPENDVHETPVNSEQKTESEQDPEVDIPDVDAPVNSEQENGVFETPVNSEPEKPVHSSRRILLLGAPKSEHASEQEKDVHRSQKATLPAAAPAPVNSGHGNPLPVLNNDGDDDPEIDDNSPVAIKGCTYIYAPKGQAGEYSPLAANPYRGCGHGCKYCYVPAVLHMKRPEFDAGAVPRPEFLRHLRKDAAKYQAAGRTEQVMLSFTTDPYHLGDTTLTRQTIECLQEHGLAVCTLTKGGTRAMRDLDMFRPSRDAFASTLTSLDDAFSRKWESNAALPGDRIQALEAFHERGIYTWVSLEPTLDCDSSLEIIRQTHRFIDLYKVGRANYLPMTKATDWKSYTERIVELCAKLNVRHYIKKDLQQYLPAGYKNVLRQVQHH